MNTQNPIAKAWANAEKTQHRRDLQIARRCKRNRSAVKFLESSHKYERTFSDKSTGEFKIMNGRKAKDLNDDLFQNFLAAVSKDVQGRSLERWKTVDQFVTE
mgnify:CR=1 FL=1|tara:strand:- start:2 stop:307 length:306 start_codon:yes stop_codon:yes gene_type:complete